MRYLTQKQYQQEIEKAKRTSKQRMLRKEISKEKNKYKSKPETSKLIAIYLFALLNGIVIYSMVVMWKFRDLTYLGVLISDIAAQVLIYAIYCLKAYKAKKSEEELKFKKEKHEDSLIDYLIAGSESAEYAPMKTGDIHIFETANSENTVD